MFNVIDKNNVVLCTGTFGACLYFNNYRTELTGLIGSIVEAAA